MRQICGKIALVSIRFARKRREDTALRSIKSAKKYHGAICPCGASVDGGGNRARGNALDAQCIGVPCGPVDHRLLQANAEFDRIEIRNALK